MSSAEIFRRADPTDVVAAEQVRRILWHTAPAGTQMADVLVPQYWSQLVRKVAPNDRIECCARDGSWFCEVLVRSADANGVIVMALRGGKIQGGISPPRPHKAAADIDADIAYQGPLLKWVVSAKDGRAMKSNLDTEEQAIAWLHAYRQTVAAPGYEGREAQP